MNAPAERAAGLLAVVITPCEEEEALRTALAAAARCAGMAGYDLMSGPLPPSPIEPALVLGADAARLPSAGIGKALVVFGGTESAVEAAVRRFGVSRRAGLQYCAACLASAHALAEREGSLATSMADLRRDPEGGFLSIAAALAPTAPETDLRAIAAAFAADLATLKATPDSVYDSYAQALAIYDDPASASWDRAIFLAGEGPDLPCPEIIDVTGPRRALLRGPYVTAPPGRWRVAVRFELTDWAARNGFELGLIAGDAQARVDFQPQGAGVYEAVIEASWTRAGPVDVRLGLARPAFHGELRFLGAKIERLPDLV